MVKSNRQKNGEYKDYFDLNKYVRVIKLAKTPDLDEFVKVAKIVGVSVVLVGLLGYIIFLLMSFIPF